MNPSDILKYGHRHILRTLDGLDFDYWEIGGVCGIWSVKDIMAHLASYEHMLTEVLSPFAGVKQAATPYLTQMGEMDPDSFNDTQVGARRGLPPADVLAEYNQVFSRVADLAVKIPPEVWRQTGALPWYGPEYDLDDFIVYTFYGHKREHGAQISVFRDTLKGQQ
ncbi:MAG: hypothetical protein DWB42_03435 [Chloroflexi bacterium]|nr:hypothetical protein [Chloroflexota bacterium]MDL1882309.1 hypothetical protein [Anaerolineae bacterium CFX8]